MDFYTPIFSKIVDSSLWSEPDYVVKVFLTMLAKKDRDQIVRGSAYNIAQWAKKTEAEVLDALKILAAPDTRRLEPQPHEGRRIEHVPEGWLLLNGLYYQDLMQAVNRRAYKAEKEKERRERKKGNPMKQMSGVSKPDGGAARIARAEDQAAREDLPKANPQTPP
jgi:hypothetical protein